jgi:hypothetical protein
LINIDGNFGGEVKLDSLKFSKIVTKTVMKNNKTSGKILLPTEFVDLEVVVLLPKSKKNEKGRKVRK